MDKFLFPICGGLVLAALVSCGAPGPTGGEITEENYLHADSGLWTEYERDVEAVFALMDSLPDKADSLEKVYRRIYEDTSRENVELAKRFASVPSGLQRVYMVRLDEEKDTLEAVLARIPESMRESEYGKLIRWHIDTDQLKEGDACVPFECVTDSGEPFDWQAMSGRNVLLLYGGLDCMGSPGRNYLKGLLGKTDRRDLTLVVYWPVSDSEGLKKCRDAFDIDCTTVSDFKRDGSPIKVVYGSQATPTCFLSGRDGRLLVKSVGLAFERVEAALAADGMKL